MTRAVLNTPSGPLEGRDLEGCLNFRGIPFAQPPVGPLRYREPQPPQAWISPRDATEFGVQAAQNAGSLSWLRRLMGTPTEQGEDCLYLNVWTPAADGGRRPVLVWIHGGAFTLGSGSMGLYDGERLARRGDVVVVTLNYRLGALGFLDVTNVLGDHSGITANAGLHDQIAALQWVRDHIADFGGDPEQVTLFGESAGAMSVGTLLATPAAQGLFARAILQSGAASNVSAPLKAAAVAEAFTRELGPDGRSVEALRGAPIESLLRAQLKVSAQLGLRLGILPWQPSVDGHLLAQTPLEAIRGGRIRPRPTIIGTNRDEWRLFLLGDPDVRTFDEARLQSRLARTLAAMTESNPELAEAALTHYGPGLGSALERWCVFQSDRTFHAPADLLADACAGAGADVYSYRFDWVPPALGTYTGSFHALEIPFVFGTLRSGLLRSTVGVRSEARSLSNRMQQAWVSFARDGVPHPPGYPAWTPYTRDRPCSMIFGPYAGVHDDIHRSAVDFFGPLLGASARGQAPSTAPGLSLS